MPSVKNRSAYVRSPYEFEVRDNPVGEPAEGEILVEIAACGVCGTDLHIADRLASEWQAFGHEVAGIVRTVGPTVDRFKPGERVAIDSSAPCGTCEVCRPAPFGRGRPDLCPTPATYWGRSSMGFGNWLISPHQPAIIVPDDMSLDVACLVEPLGVSLDLVKTAEVKAGDHVLIVGPGPLGLGAVAASRQAGADRIVLAGRSRSIARMQAGEALGADELLFMDRVELTLFDFGRRKPDKVLVTSPPETIPQALNTAAYGGIVAYIGIAFGPGSLISFDADKLHFQKISLRPSYASPGTHAGESIRLLQILPDLGNQLISHRFELVSIAEAMRLARDDRKTVKKMVMVVS